VPNRIVVHAVNRAMVEEENPRLVEGHSAEFIRLSLS